MGLLAGRARWTTAPWVLLEVRSCLLQLLDATKEGQLQRASGRGRLRRTNRSSSSASVGNNGSTQSIAKARKARTPRTRTSAGLRLEEIDRPLIVPRGVLWERHPYTARDPSTVQGALVRQMYPPPIGPKDDQKPVLCWEDYKWSPGPEVRTASSKIVEEFWWRFKLANGDTVFHCSGARNAVATRQFLKLKTGKDPGISGAWLHTHNLYRGTDQERICSQRTADRWEDFDKAMKNAHGENWEEEHPDLDGQIIYEAAGRMPHGRLGIANELFSKEEKVKFKSKRVMASEPVRSAREDRLERENKHLKRENKHLRGIELVVQSLAEKGGVDFDGIMQSAAADLSTSDSEGGFRRGPCDVRQHGSEKVRSAIHTHDNLNC
ncbi:hypothetical protein ZWY2020_031594 [Hordeum vulgare]|nr:hypothetical protein ZWY2020_031594 [Hordeum vulgare]